MPRTSAMAPDISCSQGQDGSGAESVLAGPAAPSDTRETGGAKMSLVEHLEALHCGWYSTGHSRVAVSALGIPLSGTDTAREAVRAAFHPCGRRPLSRWTRGRFHYFALSPELAPQLRRPIFR